MQSKLINLTPHEIVLQTPEGERVRIPSTGLARVASTSGSDHTRFYTPGTFPCPVFAAPIWGKVDGLPEEALGTYYIVSLIVAARLEGSGRIDCFSPGTGPNDGAVRDAKGQVEAVTRLIQAPK